MSRFCGVAPISPSPYILANKNRGGRIRTDDFLLPKQALYRAELHPEHHDTSIVPHTVAFAQHLSCYELGRMRRFPVFVILSATKNPSP